MLQILLVCLLALSGTQANNLNHYGFRTLSGGNTAYGNAFPSLGVKRTQQPSLSSSFLPVQKPAIIAQPLMQNQQIDNGYGQEEPVAQVSSGYGQQIAPQVQASSGYGQQVAPQVQASSGYGQQAIQVAPQVQVSSGYGQQIAPQVQASSGYGQQAIQVAPQVQVSSGYGQQVAPQVQASSGYGQQAIQVAPQVQVSSGYGQQVAPQVQASSGYGQQQQLSSGHEDSYGQAPMSPMALFMAQPAIQQLIANMVQNYHGNNLGAAEMQNTCAVGFTQPIYESTQVTETYCRCPSGSYGFTCTENFANPCLDGSIEFTAADSRVPSTYFIKCSWGIPYLNKCPAGTVRWAQELQACIADETPVQLPVASSSYGSYNQQQAPKQALRSNGY